MPPASIVCGNQIRGCCCVNHTMLYGYKSAIMNRLLSHLLQNSAVGTGLPASPPVLLHEKHHHSTQHCWNSLVCQRLTTSMTPIVIGVRWCKQGYLVQKRGVADMLEVHVWP